MVDGITGNRFSTAPCTLRQYVWQEKAKNGNAEALLLLLESRCIDDELRPRIGDMPVDEIHLLVKELCEGIQIAESMSNMNAALNSLGGVEEISYPSYCELHRHFQRDCEGCGQARAILEQEHTRDHAVYVKDCYFCEREQDTIAQHNAKVYCEQHGREYQFDTCLRCKEIIRRARGYA